MKTAIAVYILLVLAFWGAVGFVALHFLSKVW